MPENDKVRKFALMGVFDGLSGTFMVPTSDTQVLQRDV